MKNEIFQFATFPDLSWEAQGFAPGFEGDDFHVMAPATGAVQRLRLKDDRVREDHFSIDGWRAVSDYNFALNGKQAYLFQLGGLYQIDLEKKTKIHCRSINGDDLDLHPANIMVSDKKSGDLLAVMDHIVSAETRLNAIQVHRFHPDLTSEILLNLPGDNDLIGLSDGFVVCPPFFEPNGPRTQYRVFAPDATPQPGPLQKSLNELLRRGVRVTAPPSPNWGGASLWTNSLHRPWALFSYADSATGPSSRTWVVTLPTDTSGLPLTSPIIFETQYEVKETIRSLVLSPTHNLFLATVGNTDEPTDSVMIWLCRVVKKDGVYRAEGFRVQPFGQIRELTFSRDGSTILFFAIHENRWQVAAAHLADIVADVNRRYPNAKFNLDELK